MWLEEQELAPNIHTGRHNFYDGDAAADFNHDNVLYNRPGHGDLIIGSYCSFARNVRFIMGAANHPMNTFSTFIFPMVDSALQSELGMTKADMPVKGDTIIGNDVWLGRHAVIMPGVHIGDGAIVGAYSIVTKDVPAYTVVAGNPAKSIRARFNPETIAWLEDFQWWQYTDAQIAMLVPYLTSVDTINARKHLTSLVQTMRLAS